MDELLETGDEYVLCLWNYAINLFLCRAMAQTVSRWHLTTDAGVSP
jgi:hypothetical protein